MEQLLRETLLASGTALLGIFLLPLALVRGPAEVAEPPQTPGGGYCFGADRGGGIACRAT